jgi:hypothetical protein
MALVPVVTAISLAVRQVPIRAATEVSHTLFSALRGIAAPNRSV